MIATGRLKPPDRSEDHKHLLAKRPAEAKGVVRRMHVTVGPVLDQGSSSTCVVHACDKFLTTRPVYNNGWASFEERFKVYKEVQGMDEWDGDNYDGTSVRAMMKWLKKYGYISEYKWGFDCETVVNHVLAFGPVEMGTIWDEGMSQPDRYGYIAPNRNDSDDEGHAWTIVGADRERIHRRTGRVGAVRMINSWGRGWGDNGRAWITFEDLDRLIKAEGEAAVAMEIKRAA